MGKAKEETAKLISGGNLSSKNLVESKKKVLFISLNHIRQGYLMNGI